MRQVAGYSGGISITGLDVWPVQQPGDGRAFVVVRLSTEAGDGWGEAAAGGDVVATARQLAAYRSRLVGQDATRREYLQRLLAGRPAGTLAPGAGAIDMALIDLLGKLAEAPAYEVLGGPTRHKARAAAVLEGEDEPALMRSLERARQAGFRAAVVPLPVPAGPTRGRRFYAVVAELLERMRAAADEQVDFVLDCAGRTTPAEAGALASHLERFHLLWLDEPAGAIHQQGLSSIAAEQGTPIGWGRAASGNRAFQDVLRSDAVDVLRPDLGRWGITQARKAAALAETYYVALAPYQRGGPIATAAALHVAAAIPNFFIQEVPFPSDEAARRMREEIGGRIEAVDAGYFALPRGPGLGISVDVEVLERYRVAAAS